MQREEGVFSGFDAEMDPDKYSGLNQIGKEAYTPYYTSLSPTPQRNGEGHLGNIMGSYGIRTIDV